MSASNGLAAIVAAAVAGCGVGKVPGTLPGEANGILTFENARVSSDTVNHDGTPSNRTGFLTRARWTGGIMLAMTRFGTLQGIEAGLSPGWLFGDATTLDDTTADSNAASFEADIGGVIQPVALVVGSSVLRVIGDFGAGFSRDDRYTYAGLRFGGGPRSRKWALDGSYRRRFGDVPGNEGAHEDHLRAVFTSRPWPDKPLTLHVGVELVRGDQRTLDATGAEVASDDYLFRGHYDMLSFVFGFGVATPPGSGQLGR